MSRITTAFQKLNGRKALIPYITAGDPNLETTLETMHEMAANGADIIELGIPFSDPTAPLSRVPPNALWQTASA